MPKLRKYAVPMVLSAAFSATLYSQEQEGSPTDSSIASPRSVTERASDFPSTPVSPYSGDSIATERGDSELDESTNSIVETIPSQIEKIPEEKIVETKPQTEVTEKLETTIPPQEVIQTLESKPQVTVITVTEPKNADEPPSQEETKTPGESSSQEDIKPQVLENPRLTSNPLPKLKEPLPQQVKAEVKPQPKKAMSVAEKKEHEKTVKVNLERHRLAARERYRQDKIALEQFEAHNQKYYGKEIWDAIAGITHDGVVMLEKHYDGAASFISGAECINKLRGWRGILQKFATISLAEKKDLTASLTRLRSSCQQKMQEYKKAKKSKKIKREKNISANDIETIKSEVSDFYADNPALRNLLGNSLDSRFMSCHPKGGSANVSWFVGGSVTGYRLTCHTKLGNRLQYSMMAAGVNVGWNIFVGKYSEHQHYYNAARDTYHPVEFLLPYDSARVKVHPNVNLSMGAGFGLLMDFNGLADMPAIGVGLGYDAGLGVATLIKMRDLPSDYRPLYQTMEMGFQK